MDCIYYLSCVAQNVCLLFALRVSECLNFELKPRGFKATNDKEQMLCFCFCSVSSTLLIIFHHSQEFENASKAYGALEQKSPLFDTCNTWWCWWEKHMHPTQIYSHIVLQLHFNLFTGTDFTHKSITSFSRTRCSWGSPID